MNLECSGKSAIELKFKYRRGTSLKCRNNSFNVLQFKRNCYLLKGRGKENGVREQNRYPAEKNIQIQR